MTEMYVILWKYSDGSANGVVTAHLDKDVADSVMALLEKHGDGMKVFSLHEMDARNLNVPIES